MYDPQGVERQDTVTAVEIGVVEALRIFTDVSHPSIPIIEDRDLRGNKGLRDVDQIDGLQLFLAKVPHRFTTVFPPGLGGSDFLSAHAKLERRFGFLEFLSGTEAVAPGHQSRREEGDERQDEENFECP